MLNVLRIEKPSNASKDASIAEEEAQFTGRSADHSANAESNMCFAIRYI